MSEDARGPQVQRAIRQDAADRKRGMTLDEVAAFVDEARRQEVPGETIVSATATWKLSIKKLAVNA